MKRSTMATLIFALIVSAPGLMGCPSATTTKITMSPKIPGDVTGRVPFSVGLYLTPEFETNHQHVGPLGFGGSSYILDYDLGSASKALFIETFMRIARGVLLVNGRPPYGGQDIPAVAIVIEPSIVGFGQEHPAYWIYSAHIEYRAIIYDRTGAVLLDRVYRGDGDQGAKTYSPDSSNAAVAGKAMTRAIAELVKDVIQLPVAP